MLNDITQRLMEKSRDIMLKAASSIGCTGVKDDQFKVVSHFVAENDIFAALPIGHETKKP